MSTRALQYLRVVLEDRERGLVARGGVARAVQPVVEALVEGGVVLGLGGVGEVGWEGVGEVG